MRPLFVILSFLPIFGASSALAGNVLLPSDSNSSSGSSFFSYLGLTPKTASPTLAPTATPASALAPTATTAPSVGGYSPAPFLSPTATPSTNAGKNQPSSPAVSSEEAQLRMQAYSDSLAEKFMPKEPPQILPDPAPDDFPTNQTGSNHLHVITPSAFSLGTPELAVVKRALGYDAKQVQAQCQLLLTITLQTSQDDFSMRLASGQQRTVSFNGAVQKVLIQPSLLCTPPAKLPDSGTAFFQSGNRLILPLLNAGECPAQPQNAGTLALQYKGGDNVICAYGN